MYTHIEVERGSNEKSVPEEPKEKKKEMTVPAFFSTSLFGPTSSPLLCKNGSPNADGRPVAKYLLVYISAHWCPPCRQFTPVLKRFYDQHHVAKEFEVIFISRDHSQAEMTDYFHSDHGDWMALPYAAAQYTSETMMRQYGLYGIPSLLVFENGPVPRLLTRHGRDMVLKDSNAVGFPWVNADAIAAEERRAMVQKLLIAFIIIALVFAASSWLA